MEKILSAFICHHHVFTNPFYNSQPSSCGCKPSSCLHATITTTFVEGFLYTKREKRHMYFKMLCQIQRCIVHTYHAAKIILQPSHLCFAAHTYLISNFWLARLSFFAECNISYTLMWVSTVIIGLSISFKGRYAVPAYDSISGKQSNHIQLCIHPLLCPNPFVGLSINCSHVSLLVVYHYLLYYSKLWLATGSQENFALLVSH